MKDAETLFFDLDGTLTDSKPGIIAGITYAFEQIGHPVPSFDDVTQFIGPPLRHTFAARLGEEKTEIALAHYRRHYSDEGNGLTGNSLYEDIVPVLENLQAQKRRMFVVTSKPRPVAEGVVAYFRLDRFFERVYGPEHDGTHNDKGDLIAYALKQENLRPENIVMIGDRKHDILAAKAHGIDSIGVLWGYGPEAELREAGATYIAAKPYDLLRILLH
ncbi:MAG: HAD-IA family hydrolase [Alphaproteobacteria bacterium]|nr:HAD-IA family hydrolase [Alphaproteobacteria bacterium]